MISLSIPTAPPCLAKFNADPLKFKFDGLPFQNCKSQVREKLCKNQHYQCAYCEVPIEDFKGSFHLDHINTQNDAPQRRFDIVNLVASCENTDTCGHKHGSYSVPAELNPYQAKQLHTVIKCDSMGVLYHSSLSKTVWQFAETRLNLNAPGLKSARANVIFNLRHQTISLGRNARRRIANLQTRDVGFISLHAQELGRFGYSLP